MGNVVIVAIPDENDRVWKISSEKVPHLTILFLGDEDGVANLDQIMQFVDHAASTTLNRFHLSVDRRGELGEDKADVLFFRKNRYEYKAVRDFRAALLKDSNIRTAYDSADQFEGPWTPHLTLGYPETPAKPDKDDYGFYSVEFNKIAVWTGDFEGPEFLLKDYWDELETLDAIPMDVAMSDIQHYGVKGMHWGVRREDIERAAESSTSKLGKGVAEVTRFSRDVEFESKTQRGPKDEYGHRESSKAADEIVDQAGDDYRKHDLKPLKERHPNTNFLKRLVKPVSKETRAYRKDARETYIKRLETTANSMTNASGTRQYTIREKGGELPTSQYYWEVTTREVKHAAGDTFTHTLEVIMDEDGYITDLKKVEPEKSVAQTMELGAAFLEHYGVKGMRWGVRNEEPTGSGAIRKVAAFGGPGLLVLDKNLSNNISPATHTKIGVFGGLALFDKDVRHEVREAGKKTELSKLDKAWDKSLADGSAWVAVNNSAAEHFNKHIDSVNNKYPKDRDWSNEDYSNPKGAEFKRYVKDIDKLTQDSVKHAADQLYLKNPSGTKEVEISSNGLPGDYNLRLKNVRHADNDSIRVKVKFKSDSMGRVTGFEFSDEDQSDSMTQSVDFGSVLMSSLLSGEALEHYGVKGMKWGVRKELDPRTGIPVGEEKREGLQRYLDPQGHSVYDDVTQVAIGIIVPPVQILTWPAEFRLYRAGVRGAKAKLLDNQEKKFAKNAMSPKNFSKIHNGAREKIDREVDAINQKYPNPNKDSRTKKQYDAEVLKSMQDAYRESANSLTNRANTMHLDLDFQNDGMDFKINAREGAGSPQPKQVKHAAEDDISEAEIIVEITGKIQRNSAGQIVGFKFDHIDDSAAHSVTDIGAAFVLEHYGVKGMRWGVRRGAPEAVAPVATSRVPHGKRRKTKIKTEGGESHPAHDDALMVAEARAKLKRSGTDALSNKELQDVARRIQLENQVKILTSSKGKQFVSRQFETETRNLAREGIGLGFRKGAPAAGRAAAGSAAARKLRRAAAVGAAAAVI